MPIQTKEKIVLDIYYKNPGLTVSELSKKYSIPLNTIIKWLSINKKREISFIKRPIDKKIIKLYAKGYGSILISKKLNIKINIVTNTLIKYGIRIRNNKSECDIFSVDVNYFNKIDTQNKAYFLGLLYADGNVSSQKNCFSLGLSGKDAFILKKLKKEIKTKKNIHVIKSKNKNHQNHYRLDINSLQIKNDLIKLGCIPVKSKILEFPSSYMVPDEFISHFIRGYFDGDGSISAVGKYKIITCTIASSIPFIQRLYEKLLENNIKFNIYKHHCSKCVFVLKSCKKSECLKFYKFIYSDANFFFPRKKNMFKKIFSLKNIYV